MPPKIDWFAGHTVMVLAPWASPVPLTRAWCLWEIFCTVQTGASFSICLSHKERAGFEAGVLSNYDVMRDTFAKISVRDAEAGDADDLRMILGAVRATPGGFQHLDELVVGRMRAWCEEVARALHARMARRRELLGPGGAEGHVEGEMSRRLNVAIGLQEQSDDSQSLARRALEEVIADSSALLGPVLTPRLGLHSAHS